MPKVFIQWERIKTIPWHNRLEKSGRDQIFPKYYALITIWKNPTVRVQRTLVTGAKAWGLLTNLKIKIAELLPPSTTKYRPQNHNKNGAGPGTEALDYSAQKKISPR